MSEAEPPDDGIDEDAFVPEVPEAVWGQLVRWAAAMMNRLPGSDLPGPLRPLSRFRPDNLPRRASRQIQDVLQSDARFRTQVSEWVEKNALDAETAEPVPSAALHYLRRRPGWQDEFHTLVRHLNAEAERSRLAEVTAEVTGLRELVDRLEQQVAVERDRRRASEEQARAEVNRAKGEQASRIQSLRRQITSQREEIRRAEERAEAERVRADEAEALTRRLDKRVAELADQRMAARQSEKRQQELADSRVGVLLSVLTEAARGLSEELAVPTGTPLPADLIRSTPRDSAEPSRRLTQVDRLAEILAAPGAHLIVDGYNLTKTVWPQLALSDQRERLIAALGPLRARTQAEVSVVFDGSGVGSVPSTTTRAVRVRFSPPEDIADNMIMELATAEPRGRTVVVATDDAELATRAIRAGAWATDRAAMRGLLGV